MLHIGARYHRAREGPFLRFFWKMDSYLPRCKESSRSCPPHHDITKLNCPREVAAWIHNAPGQKMYDFD